MKRIGLILLDIVAAGILATGCFAQTAPAGAPETAAVSEMLKSEGASASSAVAPAAKAPERGFFGRLVKAYADDWKGSAEPSPEAKFRGDPAPVSGPPFPFSVWPYGGSVTIGQPWTQAGPLMSEAGDASWVKKSGAQAYGWLDAGVSGGTSRGGGYSNFPEVYNARNGAQMDQMALVIERQPDTVQTGRVDWGFRIAGFFGSDYRYTVASGFLSHQLLGKNLEYGYDAPNVYVDLYVPQVAQGMDIRMGRYSSLPDTELQYAPGNYLYSHSLTYAIVCGTQSGMLATVKLSNHWMAQGGVSAGCDTMPWTDSAKVTANACLGYTWNKGMDNIYGCANSLNDGRYAYNNLAGYYMLWYHKYGADSKWHSSTESAYQYERKTPNVDNLEGRKLLIAGANGAICATPGQVTCFAPSYAIVNYQEYQAGKHDYITIRNEFVDDFAGQRTSFKTRYSEHTLGWGHWVGGTVLVRPELRFDRAYDATAFNNGTRHSQLTAGMDAVWFF